jgi:hypothetical protein
MIRRHLILRVVVSAITAAAVVAPGASAMPVDSAAGTHAKQTHHNARLVEAAAHAETMRAIGAARTARTCA